MCNWRRVFGTLSIYCLDLLISQPTNILAQSGLHGLFCCVCLVFRSFQHSFQPLACTHSIYKCSEPPFLEVAYQTLIPLNRLSRNRVVEVSVNVYTYI